MQEVSEVAPTKSSASLISNPVILRKAAMHFSAYSGSAVIPVPMAVARIQTLFIKKIVVKIEQNAPMGRARELLLRIQREMLADERYKSLIVYYDVDPM